MLFFKKKESDSEYAQIKQQVIIEFEKLSNTDSNINSVEMRNKWEAEYKLAKFAYKLSRKYADTAQDVEPMKKYREQSKQQYQHFAYLVELAEYKSNVLHERIKFEELEELMQRYEVDGNPEKTVEMFDVWKAQYEIAKSLYYDKSQFASEDIDIEAVNKCYAGASYYLAYFYIRMQYVQVHNDMARELRRKEQCLQECIKICGRFRNEIKFELMCGVAYILRGDLQSDIGKVYNYATGKIRTNVESERRNAYYHLNRLEEKSASNYCPPGWEPCEWNIYTCAVLYLMAYYVYEVNKVGKARDLIIREIEKNKFQVELGMNSPDFTEILKERLSHFQQELLGGYKYVN